MIRNLTKSAIIAEKHTLIEDILPKFIGLMLSKKQKSALVFRFDDERVISLHMLFVFYPIDVLFLDENKTVVDKKENFKPFTFCKSKKKAMYAIEMPSGTIQKAKTGIGDKIRF